MKRILLAAVLPVSACGQVATTEEPAAESVGYEAGLSTPADTPAAHDEAAIVCPGDDRCDNVETMPAAQ